MIQNFLKSRKREKLQKFRVRGDFIDYSIEEEIKVQRWMIFLRFYSLFILFEFIEDIGLEYKKNQIDKFFFRMVEEFYY